MSGFTKPSEAPASDGWKFSVEENIGSLFVFEPLEEKEIEDAFNGGTKKIIEAHVTEIDLENPVKGSETHENVWIFPAWVQGALRSSIAEGEKVLGRLGQDPDKGRGKNIAWVLEDPDEEDEEAAIAWLNSRSRSELSGGSSKSKKSSKK